VISTDRRASYRLVPKLVPAIWGGNALATRYGKRGDPSAALGESWECWDENRIAGGAFDGRTLGELRALLGRSLMGPIDPAARFPVLTKFIDAREPLSVQVHPGDDYARRVEGKPNGKTECWYILEADAGAELVLGWTRDTDREEYAHRVADGTLGSILRRVPVQRGDAFYLPAGTLHAIGAGIRLFETQQASDLTYRIFDWNRLGADGKPRELQVDKAGDVLDFRAIEPSAVRQLRFDDGGVDRTLLIAGERFLVELILVSPRGEAIATNGRPLTITLLSNPCTLRVGDVLTPVAAYGSTVTPADAESVCFDPNDGGVDALVVRPEPDLEHARRAALAAGIDPMRVDDFFGQFGE
jgi:mannose-6-phosphate isomerase